MDFLRIFFYHKNTQSFAFACLMLTVAEKNLKSRPGFEFTIFISSTHWATISSILEKLLSLALLKIEYYCKYVHKWYDTYWYIQMIYTYKYFEQQSTV